MRRMGIDEAGRGCVFGDLVLCAFVSDASDDALHQAGARDSKTLSAKQRAHAAAQLAELGQAHVLRISPSEIDAGNLNTLEEAAIARLVRAQGRVDLWIDALGHPSSLPAMKTRLCASLPQLDPSCVTIEPKADARFPVVGAASIFAKLARDQECDALGKTWGVIGSGYPSDPKTRQWIAKWATTKQPWPPFVRQRWATIQRVTNRLQAD